MDLGMDQVARQGCSGEEAQKGLGREAGADRHGVAGLTGAGALIVKVVFPAAQAAVIVMVAVVVLPVLVLPIVVAVGMVSGEAERDGVLVTVAVAAVAVVAIAVAATAIVAIAVAASTAVVAVIVTTAASRGMALPLDLDPIVQRVDRLPMEVERDAGENDVANIEGAVHRTDPETGGLLLCLELADDARLPWDLGPAAATAASSATAHIVDRDRGGRGARAATAVIAFEGHVIDARLGRARHPREGSGVVPEIGEHGSRGHGGGRKRDVIAVHIGGRHVERKIDALVDRLDRRRAHRGGVVLRGGARHRDDRAGG